MYFKDFIAFPFLTFSPVLTICFLVTVCFKVFDSDRDGILSSDELKHMVDVLLFVRQESRSKDESKANDEPTGIIEVFVAFS